jgi:molybdopterin molybdotransferase
MPGQPSSLILGFEEARAIVEEHASHIVATRYETTALLSAAGRILAEPILADRDFPPFPRATRDGYAVRAADLETLRAKLIVVGEIKAGPAAPISSLKSGEAFSIMTGAPVPPGADAVVMVEYTSERGTSVEITRGVSAGENIVPQGAEAKRGSVLLHRGTLLNETAIALAASVGKAQVAVFTRPRVAVLPTGDEIVDIDSQPEPSQIRNSNSYSLAVQIERAGGIPELLPIAPDEPIRLRELIEQGLQSDLLILTGGVSMGRYDLVEQVLADLQAEFLFTGAKIQPGRPVVFGRTPYSPNLCGAGTAPREESARSKYFFGLPGNPISTMVTFELFAKPILEALAGLQPQPLVFLHAKLKSDVRVKAGLKRFLPAILSGKHEDSQVELVHWQGSGDLAAQARANCYVVVPSNREYIPAGEWVAVMPR